MCMFLNWFCFSIIIIIIVVVIYLFISSYCLIYITFDFLVKTTDFFLIQSYTGLLPFSLNPAPEISHSSSLLNAIPDMQSPNDG